ncbi:hypothetical protein [Actinoplanes sp. L3-i22]|uniref:DUF7489 domain-containing protein n=1 Tax=Actinoplanes sp. L3-i22 TaxID=2836373 RepID=UPI001C78427A|nr:hypothetical protein [Actinoplanes sp. L3-i22]BCY09681.1 hypothetical protein L3i22_047690 [Actinoplanes sp. L3-i22]
MTNDSAWTGTVIKKSRAALDGANLYRRLKVQLDDGTQLDVKVDRDVWKDLNVGDHLVKPEGESPRKS